MERPPGFEKTAGPFVAEVMEVEVDDPGLPAALAPLLLRVGDLAPDCVAEDERVRRVRLSRSGRFAPPWHTTLKRCAHRGEILPLVPTLSFFAMTQVR